VGGLPFSSCEGKGIHNLDVIATKKQKIEKDISGESAGRPRSILSQVRDRKTKRPNLGQGTNPQKFSEGKGAGRSGTLHAESKAVFIEKDF